MSTIDLHSHSKYSSDGELSPARIVELAQECGVRTLAITDHNSVRGVGEGVAAARAAGLGFIPGIEIDASWQGLNLHILGLGIDFEAPIFAEIDANAVRQETVFCLEVVEKLQAMGFALDADELLAVTPDLAPELVVRTMMADPRNAERPELQPYLEGGARSEMPLFNFYFDYFLPGKPLYMARQYLVLDEVLDAIHSNGGVSFLAHPGGSLDDFGPQLKALTERGVMGVEAFSTYHSAARNIYFAEQARELGLLISSGSDFHGAVKPTIQLGQVDNGAFDADVARSVDRILGVA